MFLVKPALKNFYDKNFNSRAMPIAGFYYFSKEDFPGLKSRKVEFKNSHGQKLSGFIDNYEKYDHDSLIILLHGKDGAHRNYSKEIEYFCRQGFQVFSYDLTGSWDSDGETRVGYYEHVMCLKSALDYLQTQKEFKNREIYLFGHSFGGYSVLQALNFKNYNIKKVVSVSGYRSIITRLLQIFGKKHKMLKKAILKNEEKMYGKDIYSDACDFLPTTNKKVLIIQSDDDPIVSYPLNFLYMKEASKDNKNVKTLSMRGHKHNPTYSVSSALKLDEHILKVNALKDAKSKEELSKKSDWNSICELDENVMNLICDFYKEKEKEIQ